MIHETELSLFRPSWTQSDLTAFRHLHYCGIKHDYFVRSRGLPGPLLEKAIERGHV